MSDPLEPGLGLLVELVDKEHQEGEPIEILVYEDGLLVVGVKTSMAHLEELAERGHIKLQRSGKGGTVTVAPEGRREVTKLREPEPETAVSLGGEQIDRVVLATIACVEHLAKEAVTPAEIAH